MLRARRPGRWPRRAWRSLAWSTARSPLVYALVVAGRHRPRVRRAGGEHHPAAAAAAAGVRQRQRVGGLDSVQLAAITGPAAGGLDHRRHGRRPPRRLRWPPLAEAVFVVLLLRACPERRPHRRAAAEAGRAGGPSFVSRSPVFLAAITLDLFAVLFGGAVALLPIFAKDILQVGPAGLGWLRAAPAAGALTMALVTTRLPPWQRPGRVLLFAVAGFGLATIGFGLSRHVGLSLACLFLTGVCDNVSVVIRLTLEQMITPDALARAGLGDQVPVRQLVERVRRVRERRDRGAVRSDRCRWSAAACAPLAWWSLVLWAWPVLVRLGPFTRCSRSRNQPS